ncbi:TIR domain-containing protein [Gandjariella thermophila]|uniref:TIR domain-containing protein n=1 Tax=Gandjariella thermophila TaxID=1931992 RepID=A0A4D4J0F6_9PSEU|nr:TIR domain-containing protein [Gandjariella thermophila]GDY28562.1 hypothetical protein GTS_01950 [Gandjariella thermophila]
MKVFISWPGAEARTFALFLRTWLRQVVQAVKPFMPDEDIAKGTRNMVELGRELEQTEFGIVVLTRQNLAADRLADRPAHAVPRRGSFAPVPPAGVEHPQPRVRWQDELRALDGERTEGRISADDYRRRRHDILSRATRETDDER